MMAIIQMMQEESSDDEPHDEAPHSSTEKDDVHVMISYQSKHQAIAKKVEKQLVSEGYFVWMDMDDMQGSDLSSMAYAVERASVVLMCMSKKYEDSHNCRTEGQYINSMRKPFIPILVEKGYEPGGWLGAMARMTQLCFDLSSEKRFVINFPLLLEQLSTKVFHKDKPATDADKTSDFSNETSIDRSLNDDPATEADKTSTSSNETPIDRSLNLIERALESQSYLVEEVRALTLSAGDNEKSKTLVRKGILKSLLKMMNDKNEELKLAATAAVGALAFANAQEIETFEGGKIMELLRNFSTPKLTDLQVTAKEALLFFEPGNETQAKPTANGHVMISYQWDSQAIMIKVRDELVSKGYKVWIDIKKMSGSLLDSMSKAVQEAYVVLVAVSEKYKNSYNCGKEGKYVFKKRKPIIPILVETSYEADDWLGILIGDELYFDLSKEEKFEENLPALLNKLSTFKDAC